MNATRTTRRVHLTARAWFGIAVFATLVVVALGAGWLAPHDPLEQDLLAESMPPAWAGEGDPAHLFGTDTLGRDILSRLIWGARPALIVALAGASLAGLVGTLLGLLAGYLGGWVDAVLMRITDVFLAFPRLVLALAFAAALGPGIMNAVIAISLTAWPPYARLARAETIAIARSDFVAAVVLQGASTPRILIKHIMPLCLSSVIVRLTLDMAGVILTAAGLGFLGVGAQPGTPEWGAMVSGGRDLIYDQWWVATIPGIAIFIVSLGFNLIGDGLRDIVDPKNA